MPSSRSPDEIRGIVFRILFPSIRATALPVSLENRESQRSSEHPSPPARRRVWTDYRDDVVHCITDDHLRLGVRGKGLPVFAYRLKGVDCDATLGYPGSVRKEHDGGEVNLPVVDGLPVPSSALTNTPPHPAALGWLGCRTQPSRQRRRPPWRDR